MPRRSKPPTDDLARPPGDPTPEQIRVICRRIRLVGFQGNRGVSYGPWTEHTEAKRRGCVISDERLGAMIKHVLPAEALFGDQAHEWPD